LGRDPGGGLIIASDVFTIVHNQLFIRLAQQHRLPAVYFNRTSVAQGALMSYGPDIYDVFRRSASYVDRILKAEKPADLPVQPPTKFKRANTPNPARAPAPKIPKKLFAPAGEVIERAPAAISSRCSAPRRRGRSRRARSRPSGCGASGCWLA